MKLIIPLVLGAIASGALASPPSDGETVIPFISSLRSVEWKGISDDAAYVRGGNGDWYLVRTTNRCTHLRSSLALGFDISAADQLDRHGALLVEGQRCPVASITRSDEPPPRLPRKTRRTAAGR